MSLATMTTAEQRKAELEAAISREMGFVVEITFRAEREFTFSAEGNRDFGKLVVYLGGLVRLKRSETVYDGECDLTCCYVDFK